MPRSVFVFAASSALHCATAAEVRPSPTPVAAPVAPVASTAECDPGARIPFTPALIAQYGLTPDEIQQIQFYTSGRFLLSRVVVNQAHDTSRHQLVVRNGTTYEEYEVRCLTPGRVVSFASSGARPNDHLNVAFEQGAGAFDFFAYPSRHGGAFAIFPPPGNRETGNRTSFEGGVWEIQGDSALLIDRAALDNVARTHHTATGFTFDGGS